MTVWVPGRCLQGCTQNSHHLWWSWESSYTTFFLQRHHGHCLLWGARHSLQDFIPSYKIQWWLAENFYDHITHHLHYNVVSYTSWFEFTGSLYIGYHWEGDQPHNIKYLFRVTIMNMRSKHASIWKTFLRLRAALLNYLFLFCYS